MREYDEKVFFSFRLILQEIRNIYVSRDLLFLHGLLVRRGFRMIRGVSNLAVWRVRFHCKHITVDFHSLRIIWFRIPALYSAIHCTERESGPDNSKRMEIDSRDQCRTPRASCRKSPKGGGGAKIGFSKKNWGGGGGGGQYI